MSIVVTKSDQSSSTDLLKWLSRNFLLIIPHEGFKFRPISFAKEGNYSRFLFLNGGFDSTGGSDHVMLLYYKSYIQPHFNYCNVIWGNASNFNVARITRLQRRACKIILGNEYIDFESAISSLKILSFKQSVFLNKAKVMFKVANGSVPQYISDIFKRRSEIAQNTSLRSITNENFTIPKPSLALYKESISYSGPVAWKSIPNEIKHSLSISSFSDNVKKWITRS